MLQTRAIFNFLFNTYFLSASTKCHFVAFFESSQSETYKSSYTGAVCKKVVQEGYGTINLKTKSEKTIFDNFEVEV